MDSAVFSQLSELALKHSGQLLPASKGALAQARLMPLLRREGFADVAELLNCIEMREHESLTRETVARLASLETWFFRKRTSLETLTREILPVRIDGAEDERIRIWCAGAASGQEAYSLAMLIAETPAFEGVRVDLLATDLNADMVSRTRSGLYSHFEIQRGLSVTRMLEHFRPCQDGSWQAHRPLRDRISVRQHNLLDDMAGFGTFDAILCRNVLSGMASAVQSDVLGRLSAQLRTGGRLVVDPSEHIAGLAALFDPDRVCDGVFMTHADSEAAAA